MFAACHIRLRGEQFDVLDIGLVVELRLQTLRELGASRDRDIDPHAAVKQREARARLTSSCCSKSCSEARQDRAVRRRR